MRSVRRSLFLALGISLFVGYMVATTGAFFVPALRFAGAPLLCDGELVQRLPISNKRLNLYCRAPESGQERAIAFGPYLVITSLIYGLVAFLALLLVVAVGRGRAGSQQRRE